ARTAPRSDDAVEWKADPGDAAGPRGAGMGESCALHHADPGARTGPPARAARAGRCLGGAGPPTITAARDRPPDRVALRDGALRLAAVPQSPRSRRDYGHGWDTLPKRAPQS